MIFLKKYEDFGSGQHAAFDNSSGDVFWGDIAGGVLPYCNKTKRFMLNYRSKYVNEPNTYGLWGGKIETDENIIDAVKREFYEECGYNGVLELIPLYIFKNNTGTFQYHNFITILDEEFIPTLDWESEGWMWVTFDELININHKHPGLEKLLKDKYTLYTIKRII
jgi:8-oxo-dGTP pyrophosphatase MutT (NUDIX family)